MGKRRQADAFGRLNLDSAGTVSGPAATADDAGQTAKPGLARRLGLKRDRPAKVKAGAGPATPPPAGVPPEDDDFRRWQGKKARDATGKTVLGTVKNVFLDNGTGKPTWVSVQNLSSGPLIVPYAGVLVVENRPVFAYTLKAVRAAPKVGTDSRLSKQDEAQLRTYYGIEDAVTTG